jgi:hypothetical protein
MRYRRLVWVPVLLMASATWAQMPPSATPHVNYRWTVAPAAASSVEYRVGRAPGVERQESPFRFRDANEGSMLNIPPPRPMDRAAVLGTGRAWLDGRPPLDCAQTPMDAKCH